MYIHGSIRDLHIVSCSIKRYFSTPNDKFR